MSHLTRSNRLLSAVFEVATYSQTEWSAVVAVVPALQRRFPSSLLKFSFFYCIDACDDCLIKTVVISRIIQMICVCLIFFLDFRKKESKYVRKKERRKGKREKATHLPPV